MLIREIVTEGDFGIKTGINAVKSLFKSKPAVPAAKPVDPAAALRADQDARLMAIGKGTRAAQFKPGDVVNVDLRAYKNHHNTGASWQAHKGTDSDIAKVVEIIPFPNQPGSFLAKVESSVGKAGKERIMHRGQHIGWKDVPAEVKSYTIPIEFISKRAP
jgi:hypothetical protein